MEEREGQKVRKSKERKKPKGSLEDILKRKKNWTEMEASIKSVERMEKIK